MSLSFLWPWLLLSLGLLPLASGAYLWLLRRRRKLAVGFTDLSLVRAALEDHRSWRRHVVPILLLLALGAALLGLARPTTEISVPLSRTTIILALDVSRSMCAVDVEPNRLTVAQQAASEFVDSQADSTKIGIVAFAGFAELVVAPTNDKTTLIDAIEGFSTSFGTAMGSATMRSLDALSEINPEVVPAGVDLSDTIDRESVWADDKVPDIVVVLTDGANTQGVDPLFAAEQAADRRVRVFTIGFGTTEETQMVCNPAQAGADFIADPFGEEPAGNFGPAGDFGQIGGFGAISQFLVIDEPTLQSVAGLTGGEYFRAEDAEQLLDVFLNLPAQITEQSKEVEITWAFAAASATLVLAALAVSTRRTFR